MDLFLERPQGTDALPVAGSVARPAEAIRAVLQTADGGVLVKSVRREADGSFTGEVYGVTPQQRQVAVGDRVTFSEPQIFRFKTADVGNIDPAEIETAEMIRAFAESFRNAAAPEAARPVAADVSPPDLPMDVETPPVVEPLDPPSMEPAEIERPPVAASAPPPKTDSDISIADAYATLRATEQPSSPDPVAEPARDESPPLVDSTPLDDQTAIAPPAPPEEAPAASREPIACLECGTTVVVPAVDASGQPPSKVSCPGCGRINDIAQAEAAMLRRRRLRAGDGS
jgi:hypothetical protein